MPIKAAIISLYQYLCESVLEACLKCRIIPASGKWHYNKTYYHMFIVIIDIDIPFYKHDRIRHCSRYYVPPIG